MIYESVSEWHLKNMKTQLVTITSHLIVSYSQYVPESIKIASTELVLWDRQFSMQQLWQSDFTHNNATIIPIKGTYLWYIRVSDPVPGTGGCAYCGQYQYDCKNNMLKLVFNELSSRVDNSRRFRMIASWS